MKNRSLVERMKYVEMCMFYVDTTYKTDSCKVNQTKSRNTLQLQIYRVYASKRSAPAGTIRRPQSHHLQGGAGRDGPRGRRATGYTAGGSRGCC